MRQTIGHWKGYILKPNGLWSGQNYNRAIELYEFLETRYPFGVYGQQALLDLAYVYYKIGNHEQALSTTDRFIRLYPQNNHVDYAYYLQGLINFSRNKSLTDRFVKTDSSQRDVSSAYASFQNFSELLERFSRQPLCRRCNYANGCTFEIFLHRTKSMLQITICVEMHILRQLTAQDLWLKIIQKRLPYQMPWL